MSDSVEQKVLQWLDETGVDLTIQESDLHTPLRDLGVDSLAIFEVLEMLEEKTGTTIDDAAAETLQTVGAIVEYVRRAETP